MTESHLDTPRSLSKQPGLTLITRTWMGDYDNLEDFAKTLTVGRKVETFSSIDISKDDIPDGFLASAELTALNGKRGRLSLTIAKHQENVEVWGLEPAEIQKPIRTWMADAQNTSDRPDLALLDKALHEDRECGGGAEPKLLCRCLERSLEVDVNAVAEGCGCGRHVDSLL